LTRNAKKLKKTKLCKLFQTPKEKSDLSMKEASLESSRGRRRSTEPGCLRSRSCSLLESSGGGGVHGLGLFWKALDEDGCMGLGFMAFGLA